MHISKNSATQIVEEISKLVKQNINLMDETGHIFQVLINTIKIFK